MVRGPSSSTFHAAVHTLMQARVTKQTGLDSAAKKSKKTPWDALAEQSVPDLLVAPADSALVSHAPEFTMVDDDIDHPGSGADVTLVQLASPVFVHKKVISTSTPQVRTTTVPVTRVSH